MFTRASTGKLSFNDLLIETPGMYKIKKNEEILGKVGSPPILPHQQGSFTRYPIHTARARAFPGQDIGSIRTAQNMSQGSVDARGGVSGPQTYGNWTPEELRASRRPVVGGGYERVNIIGMDQNQDDYSTDDDEAEFEEGELLQENVFGIPSYQVYDE